MPYVDLVMFRMGGMIEKNTTKKYINFSAGKLELSFKIRLPPKHINIAILTDKRKSVSGHAIEYLLFVLFMTYIVLSLSTSNSR